MKKEIIQNKNVKVFLKTGQVIEGMLLDWDENEILLYQGQGSGLYILNPYENVLMIKVLAKEELAYDEKSAPAFKNKNMVYAETPLVHYPNLKKEQIHAKQTKPNIDKGNTEINLSAEDLHYLKLCKLADLRTEQTRLEKELVTKKVKDFEPTGLQPVKYQSPYLN